MPDTTTNFGWTLPYDPNNLPQFTRIFGEIDASLFDLDELTSTTSILIGADTDANGSGIIDLQTRELSRLAITNDGKLGVGTISPSAYLQFDKATVKPGSGSGSYGAEEYFRFENNDSGNPDWNWRIGHAFQDNAVDNLTARPYHSWSWGYNVPSSGGYVSADHSFGMAIETPYISGVGTEQTEYYLWFNGRPATGPNPTVARPFGMNIHLEDNAIDINARSNLFIIGYQDNTNDWLTISSTDTEGTMLFGGTDCGIKLVDANAREWFIDTEGFGGIMGRVGGVLHLVAGGDVNEEINLFKNNNPSGDTLLLSFGGSLGGGGTTKKGLRWNGSDFQFEFQDGNNDWHIMGEALPAGIQPYSVFRTLGEDVDDWVEIGALEGVDNGGTFSAVITVMNTFPAGTQKYLLDAKGGVDDLNDWRKLIPISSSDTSEFAVDYKGNTGMLRLRRTGTAAAQAIDISVIVERYGPTSGNLGTFTPSSGSGTGATIAGIFRNAPSQLPSQSGQSGKYLTTDGSVASWATVGGGTATAITVADTADSTCSVALFESATGDLAPKTDGGLTYDASTGVLAATGFSGPLNGSLGAGTPSTIVGTTIQANTGFVPDANDGAYLGTSALGFSDLFLAEGGVINWDNGDFTVTQAGNLLTFAGGNVAIGGTLDLDVGGTNHIVFGVDADATTYGAISMNGVLSDAGLMGFFGGGGSDANFYMQAPAGGGINFRTNGNANSDLIVGSSGAVTIANLAGSGSRAVLADASGVLSAPVSDARLKTNVRSISSEIDVLASLDKMRGVYFDFIPTEGVTLTQDRRAQIGMIADEVEAVFPEMVGYNAPVNGVPYRYLRYDLVAAYLIEVLKAQQSQIRQLQERGN